MLATIKHKDTIKNGASQITFLGDFFADDISKISTSIRVIQKTKNELSVKIAQRELKINESKTEEYTINRAN